MCQFCHQHGEGKKWYLSVANFSEELYRETGRFSVTDLIGTVAGLTDGRVEPSPAQDFVWRHSPALVRWIARRYQQEVHWGQVLPIEDTHAMIDMLDWVVRLPCACRAQTIGDKNARYCFGLGVAPIQGHMRHFFEDVLDPSLGLEKLSREEAKDALSELDERGAMHTVWTFKTPFIGAICNCDRDCGAYRAQLNHHYQVMYRGEYVARIDPERCSGCRRCMERCLFGAITFSLGQGRCVIDERKCYGCGLCRTACNHEAISLLPRSAVPAVAGLWDL